MHSLEHLFEETLKDVYFAEKAILKALPKMAKKTDSEDLRSALLDHEKQTQGQVSRLEDVFKIIGKKAVGKECPALKGLVEETEELMKEADNKDVMDAGLIGCAQAVEHYEIARYGTLRSWAELLGYDDAVTLLQETLDEEVAADRTLTDLSQTLNLEALGANSTQEGHSTRKHT